MRALALFSVVAMVCMVTANTDENERKRKKREGCLLNGQLYEAGDVAYEDLSHCLRLKCIKRTNKRGKTKFLMKPKPFKGCRCSVPCPKCSSDYEPVCGTNNKTYVNQCQIWGIATPCGRDQTSLLHMGECGKCPTDCPDIVRPVCGTDNKTYDNECHLLQAGKACDSASTIEIAHRVKCEDVVPSSPGKGSQCRYNKKKFELGETIQYLGNFCLEVSCQPTGRKKKAMVSFQELQSVRSSCNCASKEHENDAKWIYDVKSPTKGE